MSTEPAPLSSIELRMLDLLRTHHRHHWRSIHTDNLRDQLNDEFHPGWRFGGSSDNPEDAGLICDRAMREMREHLEEHHFPCWACQAGYFYGTEDAEGRLAVDAWVARRDPTAKLIAFQVKLGNITRAEEAEAQRVLAGRAAEQIALPAIPLGYQP